MHQFLRVRGHQSSPPLGQAQLTSLGSADHDCQNDILLPQDSYRLLHPHLVAGHCAHLLIPSQPDASCSRKQTAIITRNPSAGADPVPSRGRSRAADNRRARDRPREQPGWLWRSSRSRPPRTAGERSTAPPGRADELADVSRVGDRRAPTAGSGSGRAISRGKAIHR